MQMKHFAALLAVIALASADPPEPSEGYRWVINDEYSDEFNGNSLDRSKWNNYFTLGWNGRKPAFFEPSTVSVKGGLMRIQNGVLKKPRNGYNIAGGAVTSKKTGAHFGYYETRFKASRIAMSTTFWMANRKQNVNFVTRKSGGRNCPKDRYSQELDIVEAIGGKFNGNDKFRANMNFNTHYRYVDCNGGREKFYSRGNNAVEGSGSKANARLSSEVWEDYHTYGAHWQNANNVAFFADNKEIGTVKTNTAVVDKPFDRPMGLCMVTETYDWARPVPSKAQLSDPSISTSYYDWVRSHKMVKVDAPVSVNYPGIYKTSIRFYAAPKIVGKDSVEVSFVYKANKDLNLYVYVDSLVSSPLKVFRGYGKRRAVVGLSLSVGNGLHSYYAELRDGSMVVASVGRKPGNGGNPPTPTPSVSTAVTIPAKIQAEAYTKSYGVKTENTQDNGGGMNVGWIDAKDYMEYQIYVPTDSYYPMTFRVAALNSVGKMTVTVGYSRKTIEIPVTRGWQKWVSVNSGMELKRGAYTVRLTANTNGFNVNWFSFEKPRVTTPRPTPRPTPKPTPAAPKTMVLYPTDDAYLQNGAPYNNLELRVERNRRVSYLMFNLRRVFGKIIKAELTLSIDRDGGRGPITAYKGTTSTWKENQLNRNNAPRKGAAIGSISGLHRPWSSKTFKFNAAQIEAGELLSIILEMGPNSNDVSFMSSESKTKPVLRITYQ